jgi:hypothetical protein
VDFPATSPDPSSGTMIAEIDPQAIGGPGIYKAEMAVFDPDDECIAAANQFYLTVEPSLFGGQCGQRAGAPSMAEMRMELRDCSPGDNQLLSDSFAFSDSEIMAALVGPVDYWNEALPPIPPYYTTQNFPYRFMWKLGATALLFRVAAEYHRRNQVQYSAGGVTFDQHGQKAEQYEQAAAQRWAEYKEWVRSKKMSNNAAMGWGELPSDYSRYSYRGAW